MERLWTPWRLAYISGESEERRKGVPKELAGWPAEQDKQCVFCNMIAAARWAVDAGMKPEDVERAALIVEQGESCFVCLNRFPYTTGHVMVVPYAHVSSLAGLSEAALAEMISTARSMEIILREVYRPDGFNLGMNLGEAAGAGVADHLHLHELPRWSGDTNFMTVAADTRILPEPLDVTWERLKSKKMQLSGQLQHHNSAK